RFLPGAGRLARHRIRLPPRTLLRRHRLDDELVLRGRFHVHLRARKRDRDQRAHVRFIERRGALETYIAHHIPAAAQTLRRIRQPGTLEKTQAHTARLRGDREDRRRRFFVRPVPDYEEVVIVVDQLRGGGEQRAHLAPRGTNLSGPLGRKLRDK